MWVEFTRQDGSGTIYINHLRADTVRPSGEGSRITVSGIDYAVTDPCEVAVDKLTSEVEKRLAQIENQIREANATPPAPIDLPAEPTQTELDAAVDALGETVIAAGNQAAAANASDTVAAIAATEQTIQELAAQDGAGEVTGQTA